MKLKITDEKLDELIFKKGLVFKSCFAEGFRDAEQVHQATVDKLMEIIQMQNEALETLKNEFRGLVNEEFEADFTNGYIEIESVTAKTDQMLKELNKGEANEKE